MKLYFLLFGLGLSAIVGVVYCHANQPSNDSVEVIVGGKQYKSIKEYQREKVKQALAYTFEEIDLRIFSEAEIFEIMREILKGQAIKPSIEQLNDIIVHHSEDELDKENVKKDALDLNPAEMQEMLNEYLKGHTEISPILIDPNKVKSIIIEPKAESKTVISD